MKMIRHRLIMALLFVISLPLAVDAQQQESSNPRPDRAYDVLLVKSAGGGQAKVMDPESGEVVFTKASPNRSADVAIEWALSQSRVTAVVDGTFKLQDTLSITVSNTSLIVGPNAELVTTEEPHDPIIKVSCQDHVNLFNLGSLIAGWEQQGRAGNAVWYDGRNGGKNGIDGGMIFAPGTLKNVGPGYWLIDTTNVKVPLAWSKNFWKSVINLEGNEDTEIGLAAGLRTSTKGMPEWMRSVTNEVVDLNGGNRRTRIHRMIGTWVDGQQEFLDVANSPKTVLDRLWTFGKVDKPKEELFGVKGNFVDRHAYGPGSGFNYTQKPYDNNNSPGTEVKNQRHIDKTVKAWNTEVKTPGFPENLPELKINVRLTAMFQDGSTKQVFANKYRYDLTNATNPSGK